MYLKPCIKNEWTCGIGHSVLGQVAHTSVPEYTQSSAAEAPSPSSNFGLVKGGRFVSNSIRSCTYSAMFPDMTGATRFVLGLALLASSEAFFLKWGSDTSRQPTSQKWVQTLGPNMSPAYRYQYYSPYEPRKVYQMAPQPQYQPEMPMHAPQSMAPIPISMPAGASLTPVSLQHVQLVPCMCPVAPEEAEKLQEQVGPGPYLAQTYNPQSHSVPQQMTVAGADNTKISTNQ